MFPEASFNAQAYYEYDGIAGYAVSEFGVRGRRGGFSLLRGFTMVSLVGKTKPCGFGRSGT